MDNDSIRFTARFGGVSHPVTVPISAVLAIYARETGQGMALPDDIGGSGEPAEPGADAAADAADPSVGGPDHDHPPPHIGRTQWRERGCQSLYISVVGVDIKKKKN